MSLHAEKEIIGNLLVEPNCIDQIYNIIEPEMFTDDFLGSVYAEFLKGYEKRYEVNEVVLEQKLVNDQMPLALFQENLGECISLNVSSVTIRSCAEVVLRDFKAKRLDTILNRIKVNPDRINDQIGTLINDLEQLSQGRETQAVTLSSLTKDFKDHYFCDEAGQGLNTGFRRLDDMIGDLTGGDVIVIGARPSVGKSAFVTQIAMNLIKQGKRVGFYNLEMQNRQMYERFVVAESGIGMQRLKRAVNFQGDERERFNKANEFLNTCDNLIINTGASRISDIRAESRHMNYDIIIIDYMQLITPDTSYRGNRAAEVGEISRNIKNLAMELNIPIIALSQLNRVSEARETKEPTMAELRESGNVEQDASIILLMWNLTEERDKKGLKADKNRQGKVGKITLEFDGEQMKFVESDEFVETEEEDNPFV